MNPYSGGEVGEGEVKLEWWCWLVGEDLGAD